MILSRVLVRPRRISSQGRRWVGALHGSARLALSPSPVCSRDSPLPVSKEPLSPDDVDALLASEPVWAVESLLPSVSAVSDPDPAADIPRITTSQLHHLLRLSALPLPKSQDEEQKMLSTLSNQLHFVGKMQHVDTTGIKPLRAIRDETPAAEQEQTITLETLREALAKEKVIGKYYKRIQRDTTPADALHVEDWDVLGSAERKQGRYFVVESERPQE